MEQKNIDHHLLLASCGGPGVQRWLKFAKYLPDLAGNPLFILRKSKLSLVDESL
jgi:hypothetical protein